MLKKMGAVMHNVANAAHKAEHGLASGASSAVHSLSAATQKAEKAIEHGTGSAIQSVGSIKNKDQHGEGHHHANLNGPGQVATIHHDEGQELEPDRESSQPQPSIFVPMGAPTMLIETGEGHAFFRELGMRYNYKERKPACVVCVSARWVSSQESIKIMSNAHPKTVHDFNSFSECLYQVDYHASGSSEAAARIAEALTAGGFDWDFDGVRGYDFGCWSPLALIFPDASVPVVQVSLHYDLDARTHIALGEALAPLRDEGYLILCSGGVTHNLLELSFGSERVPAWASSYDNWVHDILMHEEHKSKHESYEDAWNARNRRLAAWMDDSEGVQAAAVIAHPTPENYMALLVAAGTGGTCTQLHHSWAYGCMSMASYMFGPFPMTAAEMQALTSDKPPEEDPEIQDPDGPVQRQITNLSTLTAADDESEFDAEEYARQEAARPPSRLGTGNRSVGSRPPTGPPGSRPGTGLVASRPPSRDLVRQASTAGINSSALRFADQMAQLTSRGPTTHS